MSKIAIIGAGSIVFTFNLCNDILLAPVFQDCTIVLMDIDKKRLAKAKTLVQAIASHNNLSVEVLATPALVAYMENTASRLLDPVLPAPYISVGSFIRLEHLSAATINEPFSCEATITTAEGREVTFSISAFTSNKELGRAEHKRIVVNREKFLEKVHYRSES